MGERGSDERRCDGRGCSYYMTRTDMRITALSTTLPLSHTQHVHHCHSHTAQHVHHCHSHTAQYYPQLHSPIADTSHSMSIAAHPSSPSCPPPHASYILPKPCCLAYAANSPLSLSVNA